MSAQYYGILGGCNGLIVILFTPLITMLTKKLEIIKIIALGGFLYALSFGWCGFASTKLSFYLIIIGISIGEIAIAINSGTFIANHTPASHRGRVNSILPLIFGTGSAIGTSFMGGMIEGIGINKAFIVIGIIAAIGSIFMYFLNYVKVKV